MTTTEIILAIGMLASWIFAYFKFKQDKGEQRRDDHKDLINTLTIHIDELKDKINELIKDNKEKEAHTSELEVKMETLIEDNKEKETRLAKVEGEYNSLVKIFQGRDETVVDYQKRGRVAFSQIAEIHGTTKEIEKHIIKISQTIYKNGSESSQTTKEKKQNDNI